MVPFGDLPCTDCERTLLKFFELAIRPFDFLRPQGEPATPKGNELLVAVADDCAKLTHGFGKAQGR